MRIIFMALALWLCLPLSSMAEASTAKTAIPDTWIQSGWQQIASGHRQQALALWQQGVNRLPDRRLLASIGVYAHFPYALEQLKQVGLANDAFIIRRQQGERVLYYVLSARQTPASRNRRQRLLSDLKQAAGITGILLAVEAGKLKTAAATPHVATPAPVRKAMQPIASITAMPASSFSINRFEISGNRRISTDAILINLSDFYGPGKKHSDLTSVRNQILELYHSAGIAGVHIAMPQLVNNDTVRIRIKEKAEKSGR